jgi:prolyl-tRNA editing enzyme YbaK/EbsC (Cys-tRNA(Pro) deacylase)
MSPSTEHPSIGRVRRELELRGATGRIRVFSHPVRTAAAAAAALGCQTGAIVNSLIFDAEGAPVLILTSGAHRVDTDKVATRLGVGRLEKASPDFVREHTGQVIGGVAPLAHTKPITAFIDPWLRQHETIWAAAGHPDAVFSTTYEELADLSSATPLEVE